MRDCSPPEDGHMLLFSIYIYIFLLWCVCVYKSGGDSLTANREESGGKITGED